jgi:peptidoglycan/LPS O-acetylase OafA/YrhL
MVSATSIREATEAERIPGLDGVRALAITLVLVGHASEPYLRSLATLSGLGVTIFFVLSGFLITRLLLQDADSSAGIRLFPFYTRRVARLLPALALYLVLATSIQIVQGRDVPWAAVASAAFYVINYYQAFTGAQTNIVSHCWSLAVEEQFYMLWPLAMIFLLGRNRQLAAWLVGAIVAVWLWRWYLSAQAAAPIHYLYRALDTRGDALAMGCLLAVLVRSAYWRQRLATILGSSALVPLGIICAILLLNQLEISGPAMKYGVAFVLEPPLIALALLHAVLLTYSRQGPVASLLNQRFVVHVGRISYGMYLFHGLIGFTVARLVESHVGSVALGFLAAYAAIVIFSTLSFRYFETPLRRLIAARADRIPVTAAHQRTG